ncbi:BRO family protein [Rodentibacter trehalosifermentans]|uniref:BRO family protein n=1 Tax=Rodentibacter trehalosifermentans TaxID=1908263 RepID=UPI0009871A67|nr:BRO family protein [Rodentibacter trehalosifermentans]
MSQSTQISTFNFEQNSIRTLAINNEPWFVAADVCQALGLTQTTNALRNLDEDEVALTSIKGISKGNDQVNLVSESGMYTLILRCRDAVKKGSVPHRFRKWVTAEVLPQIRKTGKYQLEPKQIVLTETITPEEQRQIQNAVKATHERTGLSYGEIWARTKNKFNVAKYEQIPRSHLRDVLIYIASMSSIAVKKPTLSYSLLYPLALLYYYSAEFHDSMVKHKAEEPKMWGLLNRQCRTMDRVRLAISMLAEELPYPEHKADILAFLEP